MSIRSEAIRRCSVGAFPQLEQLTVAFWGTAVGGRELRNERAVLGCHDGPRADFSQHRGHVKRSAGDRLLAQRGHDL
jgi:hypothetical protein